MAPLVLLLLLLGLVVLASACTDAGVGSVESSVEGIVQTAPSASAARTSASPSPTAAASPTPGGEADAQASMLGRYTELAGRTWWLWSLLGLAAGYLVGRASTPEPVDVLAPAGPGHDRPGPTDPGGPHVPVLRDAASRALVDDLVLGHDLAEDEAMADHLQQLLGRLGVVPVPADPGTPFDSRVHRAVGTAAADPAPDVPVILQVVRPGWRSPDGVVRQPEVIVARTSAERTPR